MIKRKQRELLKDVIAEYIESLERYLITLHERRFVDGNQYADRVYEAAELLRHKFGSEGRRALVAFLDHEISGIRSNAAANTIDFATARAVSVLEEIEKAARPLESLAAHYCLKNWREGQTQLAGGPVTLELGENYD